MEEPNLFLALAVILLSGLFCGRVVKHLRLPNVKGYLLAGLLLGPYVLGFLQDGMLEGLNFISEMALAFIAFSIGGEFKASYFRRVGATPIVIALCEGLGAVVVVTLALYLSGQSLPFSLILGAIASATAPAATVLVIKQYKAKGPLTSTLLSVVALDDAVALIAFGFSVALAKSLSGSGAFKLSSLLAPLGEVALSLLLGAALGALFLLPLHFFKKDSNRLCITVAFVFLGTALADMVGASALLTNMVMGAALVNLTKSAPDIFRIADFVTPPIFTMFFVVSGAELNLSVLPVVGLAGAVYIIMRVVGKWLGASLGAAVMHADPVIKKYLGPTLIPQAGVAIGLTLVAREVVPEHAAAIRAIVLCGTLIYEIIGPMVAKICLTKAGEITEQ